MFSGNIVDNENKILSNVQEFSKEHEINGSEKWRVSRNSDLQWKINNYGSFCLKIEAAVEYPCEQSIATALVQTGIVVTTHYDENTASEQSRKYLVHTGKIIFKEYCQCFFT